MNLNRTVTLGFLVLFGCGREDLAPLEPVAQQSALQASFEKAAREMQVPVQLLEAIAFVETRVSPTAGLSSQAGAHGIMAIVERDDWKMLSRASALTGAPTGRLGVDVDANIKGGAAVLRELADKSFRESTSLDANRLGDWFHAVSLYPGYDSASDAADYAAEVFVRMETGFEVPGLTLKPTASDWRNNAPAFAARRDALGGSDYPAAATFNASPNRSSGRSTYEFVVIHTTQGSYAGTVSWFKNTASRVSANYVVRSSDGQITQMVHDADTAWHAQCYNGRSIGIEHEGFVADPGRWYTDAMYTESAKLTRWLADRHGIARNRTHIIGHVEVAPSCNTGRHTDPGSGWNWTRYMNLVNGTTPTPTSGVLTGAVYTGGNSNNRLAGALVTVNPGNKTMTTGADGLYTFTLAPGSYTATVTKSGYGTNTVTRTVTASATIWGSMEINVTAAPTGILRGKVYAYNAATPTDTSVSIAGAVVTVNPGNKTATTAADGNWSFDLAPGTYTVTATKAGYANNAQTRMVTSGVTVWGSVGLTSTSSADAQPPVVAIVFPANDAQLDLAQLDLKGTASDDRGAIASVKLSINGGAATDVPVTAGAYSVSVKLKPGKNTLKVTATDAAGNAASATSNATFNAGVGGLVFIDGDEAMPLANASVELFDPASGMSISKGTTTAEGKYALGVMTVPADYKLVVKAEGYHTHSETLTVGDDRQESLDVSMMPGTDEIVGNSISFTEPQEGATVNTSTVTVYGVVNGFDALSVKVNGVDGEVLGGGGFSATVPLTEGANTLSAEVIGVNGEKVSAVLHVTRKLMTGMLPDDMKTKGTCSATGGLELFALAAVAGLLRRRSRR